MAGDKPRDMSTTQKRTVHVRVIFKKIGEIDTLKEAFEADVLLCIKWLEPELDDKEKDYTEDQLPMLWNPKINISNIIGDPKKLVRVSQSVKYVEGKAYVVEEQRVTGKFMEQLELRDFPFDVQDLSVCLKSKARDITVEMTENPSEKHCINRQSFIDEQEWYLYKYIETVPSEDGGDSSRKNGSLTVRCRAARRPSYFVWNMFTVTFLICCLSFLTFAVNPKKVENRIVMSFTLILTSVTFKFLVNNCLPKISYLTYLDFYVLAAMATLATVAFWHGIQSLIPVDIQKTCDKAALGAICGVYFLYNIVFWAQIFIKPFRKRREMRAKEAEYLHDTTGKSYSMITL